MLIQIIFQIHFQDQTISKKIEFSKNHEKNLVGIYENTKETMKRNEEVTIDQLLIVCSYHIVKKIRENPIQEIIEDSLSKKLLGQYSLVLILNQIREISADIKVDDVPKKNIKIEPKPRPITSLAIQQAWR